MAKYWVANNPNSAINNTKAQRLATISAATAVAAADLDRLTTGLKVFSSMTALAASGTLAANTLYNVTDADTAIYALPAIASSTAGDVIVLKYDTIIDAAAIHDYGTASEFFATWSTIYKSEDQANGSSFGLVTRPDGSADDYLKLTGAANGGPGVGSELTFIFDGSKWGVNGTLYSSGTGAGADVVAAFAETTG
jgi:hypothetical protein